MAPHLSGEFGFTLYCNRLHLDQNRMHLAAETLRNIEPAVNLHILGLGMDFASQQRNPAKNGVGNGIVVLMHIVLGWALLNGLARKVVEVIKAPIETKIIEEVKPPPPPPPENLPPPPKMAAPPPSFVPPPEIQVANPPPAPAITVTREAPPPAPPVSIAPAPAPAAPPAPPAVAAPPAPKFQARPAQINVANCEKPEMPGASIARRGHRHHADPFHGGCQRLGDQGRDRKISGPLARAPLARPYCHGSSEQVPWQTRHR